MKIKITYKTESGYTLVDTIECTCLDEARVTALDEIPCCVEIENIEVVEA